MNDLLDDLFTAIQVVREMHPEASPDELLWGCGTVCASRLDDSPLDLTVLFYKPMSDKEANIYGSHSLRFGKYKNRRIDDVPLSYLDWVRRKMCSFLCFLPAYLTSERVQKEQLEEPMRRRGEDPYYASNESDEDAQEETVDA